MTDELIVELYDHNGVARTVTLDGAGIVNQNATCPWRIRVLRGGAVVASAALETWREPVPADA